MALNFSHRPIFPAHLPEDSLMSPMRIANGYLVEGTPEKNGDGFARPWHSSHDLGDCFDCGRDRGVGCGSQESASSDILELLPSDPFGMDITTTFTAITGWLEDLEMGYGGYGKHETGTSGGNYQLFAGLNLIWNNAMKFQAFSGSMGFNSNADYTGGCYQDCEDEKQKEESCQADFMSACDVEDILSVENENSNCVDQSHGGWETYEGYNGGEAGMPHPALSFALYHLGVHDLLMVGATCRSLRSTVENDSLLWRNIHIDQPLNEKITDDILLRLTNRAHGALQCLSLVECQRITDEGLKRVLESNPRLSKLAIPGCTRFSIEGILSSLKALKAMGAQGVKHLRIGGLYGVTQQHFEELKFLLTMDNKTQKNVHKPHIYHRGNFYLSCDDDRAIDIEMCPRCQNFRLVYDCPAEDCKGNGHASQSCRACTLCIARCVQCGRCINDGEYEETFCLELLCSDCGKDDQKQPFKTQERLDPKMGVFEPSAQHEASGSSLNG